MKKAEWKNLKDVVDLTEDEIELYLKSSELDKLKNRLKEVSKLLPGNCSISLKVDLTVFDSEREKELPLLQTGITAFEGCEPYIFHGDATEHRYIVNGEILELPHDYCPNCWGVWDFKFKNETCPTCKYSLGKEVKLLLDENICPNCEAGEVRRDDPICRKCGEAVDLNKVTWG